MNLTKGQIEAWRVEMLDDYAAEEAQEVNALCDMALSYVQQPLPAGMVLMPEFPTTGMIDAATEHTSREEDEEKYRARGQATAVYIVMVEAFKRQHPCEGGST